MQVFHESDLKIDERPHILGLTTALINSNIKNVKDELIELQTTFNSTIKINFNDNIKM